MIPRRAEAGVALESHLDAVHLERHRDEAGVAAVGDVAVGGDDPGLVFPAGVGRVDEGHKLDDDSRWTVILVAIGVMTAVDAGVPGASRLGWDGWILDLARQGAGRPLRTVVSADVQEGYKHPVLHLELATLGGVLGQQHLSARVSHLEIVIAIGEASSRLGGIGSRPTVQVDVDLALIADVFVDDSAVRSGSENGSPQRSTRRPIDAVYGKTHCEDNQSDCDEQ